MRKIATILCCAAATLLVDASPDVWGGGAKAQDTQRASPLIGNWHVSYLDRKHGWVKGVLWAPEPNSVQGRVPYTNGDGELQVARPAVVEAVLHATCASSKSLVLEHVGGAPGDLETLHRLYPRPRTDAPKGPQR